VSRPTILIPVVFPDPTPYPLTDMPLEELTGFDIVLSGYWEVPENRSVEEVREAHQTDADAVLYDMAAQFSRAGAPTDIQLQFGPAGAARRDHQSQVAEETAADGILLADRLSSFHNILVPLRDVRHQEEVVEFVSTFAPDDLFVVELYHVSTDKTDVSAAQEMLQPVKDLLLKRGFSESDVEITVEVARDVKAAIAAKARDYNLVVMGETEEPDAEGELFGPVCRFIAAEADRPIIVVQR
jgi:nucleotide-binding universal stress UspA family protein